MQGISQERGKVVAEARGSLLLICGGGADACGAEEAADLEERLTAAVRNRLAEEPGLTVNYVDRGGPGFGFRTAFEHDGRVRIRGGAPAGYEVAVRDGGEAGVVAVRRVGTGCSTTVIVERDGTRQTARLRPLAAGLRVTVRPNTDRHRRNAE